MKKRIVAAALAVVLLASSAVFLSSCGVVSSSSDELFCFGEFSWPFIYVVKNGSVPFSDLQDPITGTPVTDATVTITNETTGTTTVAFYLPLIEAYTTSSSFPASAGNSIKLSIVAPSGTITGASARVPNPIIAGLSPSSGTATMPATVSWTVIPGSSTADYTWVQLWPQSSSGQGYQTVVPASQTTISLTSSEIAPGTYYIVAIGCNSMPLTGAGTGSVIYVTGGIPAVTGYITFR